MEFDEPSERKNGPGKSRQSWKRRSGLLMDTSRRKEGWKEDGRKMEGRWKGDGRKMEKMNEGVKLRTGGLPRDINHPQIKAKLNDVFLTRLCQRRSIIVDFRY